MLSFSGLLVLIVDDNSKRATATAQLVRVLGSIPVIAATEPVAAKALPNVDLVIACAEALGGRAINVLHAARAHRRILRVLSTSRDLVSQRGVADLLVREPFTVVALGDLLAKAHARQRATNASAPSPAPL